MNSAGIQEYIEKNLKHNLIVNALDGFAFWWGYSFYSPTVILPVFITHFTSNPVVLGLIPFLSTAGYLIPQLFTSRWVEREKIKKRIPVNFGFFLERLPVALFVPATLLFANSDPALITAVTIILFAWHSIGAGGILVGWQEMIAKVIPTRVRGRFFGVTNFLGMGGGILGAGIATWMLGAFPFPMGFVWAFALGAGFNLLSWYFLSLTKEPPDPFDKESISLVDYYRNIPALLRDNPNFVRYIFSQVIIAFSGMANGFLIVYAIQHWSLPDAFAASFMVAYTIGQAVANPALGWLADRRGYKLILEISTGLGIAALLVAFIAPNPTWFFAVFFLRGVNASGNYLGSVSIAMEFSRPETRPTFIGLANTIPGIAAGVAPLLGGWLALETSYPIIFIVSAVVGFMGFVALHWAVKEPRYIPKNEVSLAN